MDLTSNSSICQHDSLQTFGFAQAVFDSPTSREMI